MAFSRIQSASVMSSGAVTSKAITPSSPVTAGNLIVVCVGGISGGSLPTLSIMDSEGNAYTLAVSQSSFLAMEWNIAACYVTTAASTGSLTVTVSMSVAAYLNVSAAEYGTGGLSASIDSASSSYGTSSTLLDPGSVSIRGSDDLVIGFGLSSGANSWTPASSFSLVTTAAQSTGPAAYTAFQDQINVTSGPVDPSLTNGSASSWIALGLALKTGGTAATIITGTDSANATDDNFADALVFGNDATPFTEGAHGITLAVTPHYSVDSAAASECFMMSLLLGDQVAAADILPLLSFRLTDSAIEGDAFITTLMIATQDAATAVDGSSAYLQNLTPAFLSVSESGTAADAQVRIIGSADSGVPSDQQWWTTTITTGDVAYQPTGQDPGSAVPVQNARTTDFVTFAEATYVVNVVSGYRVYANTGAGDAVNYNAALAAVVPITTTSWTSGSLTVPGTWTFAVRAFSAGGEEQNLDCYVTVVFDAYGNNITNRPPAPIGLRVFAVAGGGIKVEWVAGLSTSANTPTGFRVYAGTSGTPSYTTPVATATYGSSVMNSYQKTITGYTDGQTVSVGVRAYNASGEETNAVTVAAIASSVGPTAVLGLTATTAP